MAWRAPTIILSREAVADYCNPDEFPYIGLAAQRRIAAEIAAEAGNENIALQLLQGNPNLSNIQMATEI